MLARLTPLFATAVLLVFAAPALADQYTVTSTASGGSGCTGASPAWTCPTLEGAVNAANATNGVTDEIDLQAPGAYIVSATLTLSDDVTIVGQGPRATQIDGDGEVQVVNVAAGVTASLFYVAIRNGDGGSEGGNILNSGDLTLGFAQVTAGIAVRGGGIANETGGSLTVFLSLVDHNVAFDGAGGGIYSVGTSLEVAESTVAFNSGFGGGGIFVDGPGDVQIEQATIARNTGGGFSIGTTGGADMTASLLALNDTSGNCPSTAKPADEGYNLADDTTCALDGPGSKVDPNPGLGTSLENAGGPTDVLTFPATSPAVDMVVPCFSFYDQRAFQRFATFGEPCDAGAYEQSATGPAQPTIESGPAGPTTATSASFAFSTPGGDESFVCQLTGPGHASGYTPCTSPVTYSGLAPGNYAFAVAVADPTGRAPSGTPTVRTFSVAAAPAQTPAPSPTPSPTPAPAATPVPQKDAVGKVVSGVVLVKLPGGKFARLDPTKPLPNGTEIDVTKGRIELTAVLKKGGKPEKATFYDGIFKLKLGKKTTDLTLSEKLAPCGKGKAGAAAKKPKTRKLWGNGSGSFRTRGQYSAATVRGTQWLVQDSCAGTLTKVTKGVVSVFDQVKKRTIVLRAGKSYLAKPRR